MAKKEKPFVEFGLQLKAVREEINITLEEMSNESGISRSYLSDFERGYRMPTSKFLKYLHDTHKANLNFIFGSKSAKFLPGADNAPLDFGYMQQEINRMLATMQAIPHAMFTMLKSFSEYEMEHKDIITEHLPKVKE
ncbi:MAG: helix-turn-helix transcriptional regulator [bacterium]|nr:helix-turn-helix transcriptional regulator [bacterium]